MSIYNAFKQIRVCLDPNWREREILDIDVYQIITWPLITQLEMLSKITFKLSYDLETWPYTHQGPGISQIPNSAYIFARKLRL